MRGPRGRTGGPAKVSTARDWVAAAGVRAPVSTRTACRRVTKLATVERSLLPDRGAGKGVRVDRRTGRRNPPHFVRPPIVAGSSPLGRSGKPRKRALFAGWPLLAYSARAHTPSPWASQSRERGTQVFGASSAVIRGKRLRNASASPSANSAGIGADVIPDAAEEVTCPDLRGPCPQSHGNGSDGWRTLASRGLSDCAARRW
jgi:hypothetical protein